MNEYQIQGWRKTTESCIGEEMVGNPEYYFSRREAIKAAKDMLNNNALIDEVDLQVIYDYESYDAELADVWWQVTRQGITKH